MAPNGSPSNAHRRRRGGQYLMGTPRSKLREFERELLAEDWLAVRADFEVKLVPAPGSEETYILCHSTAREEKKKKRRLSVAALRRAWRRPLPHSRSVWARVNCAIAVRSNGTWALSRRVFHKLPISFNCRFREQDGKLAVDWHVGPHRRTWQQVREGAYLLRTILASSEAEQLWESYLQLTEAEAAFRALKSELHVPPIFHQKEHRTQAHVIVALLGYALWVKPQTPAQKRRIETLPMPALALASTPPQRSILCCPPTDSGKIRLCRVTTPTREK